MLVPGIKILQLCKLYSKCAQELDAKDAEEHRGREQSAAEAAELEREKNRTDEKVGAILFSSVSLIGKCSSLCIS